jgi:hypothetical protein
MPPMMGAAMGFMMSDPTPMLHRIGSRPAITTLTVMSLGRNRSTEPAMVASKMSCSVISPPSRNHCRHSGHGRSCCQFSVAAQRGCAPDRIAQVHVLHSSVDADRRERQRPRRATSSRVKDTPVIPISETGAARGRHEPIMSLAGEKLPNQRGLQLRVTIVQTWGVRWVTGQIPHRASRSPGSQPSSFFSPSAVCPLPSALRNVLPHRPSKTNSSIGCRLRGCCSEMRWCSLTSDAGSP